MKAKIEKLDHFGRGIAHLDNKIYFINQALPDEIVDFKIVQNKKSYSIGTVTNYIKTSPYRVKAACPYFNICGGCHLEHLNYEQENEYKSSKVKELLKQIAKIKVVVDCTEYDEKDHYRNKVTLHSKNHKIGYYKPNTNELAEIESCILLDQKINNLIPALKKIALENDLEEILIRVDNSTEKLMLSLKGKIKNIQSIAGIDVLIVNGKPVSSESTIISSIGDKKYYLSIDSFFQVNKFLTKKLYDEVKENVKTISNAKVLDLYCGTGTIGIYIASLAKEVIGIDCSKSNITDADKNEVLNSIDNIRFICAKVEDVIDQFKSNIDIIIVDPPRAGLDPKTISNLKRINPKKIVYVSCDPATLARDLKELCSSYEIEYVKPFNMFPRTYHVECVSVLHRKSLEK